LSVELYVKQATQGIQKKIQENLEYAKANPYPSDELKTAFKILGPDSILSGIYSLSGQLRDPRGLLSDEIKAAKAEVAKVEGVNLEEEGKRKDKGKYKVVGPDLWKRLQNGQLGIDKKDAAENYLPNINPEEEIRAAYQKFYSTVSSLQSSDPKITVDQFFSIPDELFVDRLKTIYGIDLSLNSFGADGLVKAAFASLFTGRKNEPISSTINEKPKTESTENKPQTSVKSNVAINEKPQVESNTVKPQTSVKSEGTINEKTNTNVESTGVTSSEGSMTSKPAEVMEEKPKPEESRSTAININLENKETAPVKTETPLGSTSVTTNVVNQPTSTATTVNTTSSSVSEGSNQSNSTTVNNEPFKLKSQKKKVLDMEINSESKKPKGFFATVGKFAKDVGSALNLPSVSELGEQARGFFGATGANVSSRFSEIKESFSEKESRSSSVNESSSSSNTNAASSESSVNKEEKATTLKVEQGKPLVFSEPNPSSQTSQTNVNTSSSNVSNPASSQSSSNSSNMASNSSTVNNQSQNNNTSQNVQNQSMQPQNNPGAIVNVDLTQLAQSIARVEKILVSGIEVTIKET
jgi:hypothetical protein